MSDNQDVVTNLLIVLFIVFAIMLFVLTMVLIAISVKGKKKNKVKKEEKIKDKSAIKEKRPKSTVYNEQSIYDFMKFDKVEDNMIVQNDGKRYIMVVECQGVNYDLMSSMEKVAVEEGFQQFLNTLRHPIQIYIQTRTINLESSINRYKEQVKQIEDNYNQKLYEYRKMRESGSYNRETMEKEFFELTKRKNMLEYSRDLIDNTEKMSLNRSVLNKKYYIIIPYYPEEASNGQYQVEEIRNIAFSELYTKAQTIIRTISACSVSGKILNSKELIELLYVAYNRDESEIFGIDKALRSGYDDLYSTSPDVFEKKMKILDEQIENDAIELASQRVEKIRSRNQRIAEEKQKNLDDLIGKMAELILEENKTLVGEDVANEAIEEIREERKSKEVKKNEQKKTTNGRKRKAV